LPTSQTKLACIRCTWRGTTDAPLDGTCIGLRIEHACSALSETGSSLSSIALETGFSDQAHFTRRFKELTGMSPGRYRTLVTN
jgi:AraC family transcriptional regulator